MLPLGVAMRIDRYVVKKISRAALKQCGVMRSFRKGTLDPCEIYNDLTNEARKDLASTDGAATACRFVAWTFTALGALLAGDWTKIVRGSGDEAMESEKEERAASV